MRCFVAMGVGEAIRKSIVRMVEDLRRAVDQDRPRLTWTRPQGWHVTLEFLGDVDDARVPEICERLPQAAGVIEPFTLSAVGVATFPRRARSPRVVVVDVEDGGHGERLAASVEEVLAPLGFARERPGFTPHLTVARVRSADGWERFSSALQPWKEHVHGRERVESIALYESKLGSGAAEYSVVQRFAFAPGTTVV